MKSDIEIQDRTPTLMEYLNITDAVGWSNYVGPETAAVALANSLFCVMAIRDHRCVGIARIVGDRAIFFYVQDVAVLPDYQGQGIGDLLMARVIEWLEENAPDRAFVGLFSARGKEKFYERYGFSCPPNEGPGMLRYIRMPE